MRNLEGAPRNAVFVTRERDRENDGNGLYYYRARYYEPSIGRFKLHLSRHMFRARGVSIPLEDQNAARLTL
jgi:hypothetical protein